MPSQPPTETTATRRWRAQPEPVQPGAFLLLSFRVLRVWVPDLYLHFPVLIDLCNGTCTRIDLHTAPLGRDIHVWLDQALPRSVEVRRVYTDGVEVETAAISQWAVSRAVVAVVLRRTRWTMPARARELEHSFTDDYLRPLKASEDCSLAAWQRALAVWRAGYNARALQAPRPALTTSH